MNIKNIILSLFICLCLFSCQSDTATPSISGKWKLCFYKFVYSGTTGREPNNLERSVTVTFSDDGTNGTMDGQMVENDFVAEYTLENGQLNVSNLVSTGIDEERWGQKFVEALADAENYTLKRKKLCIYYSNGREYMVLKKQ